MKISVYILCFIFIISGILAYNGIFFSHERGYRHFLPVDKEDGIATAIVFTLLLLWTIYDDFKKYKKD